MDDRETFDTAVALTACRAALEGALPLLKEERSSWLECLSALRKKPGGGVEPIPGTLDPDGVALIARYDKTLSDIRVALDALTAVDAQLALVAGEPA